MARSSRRIQPLVVLIALLGLISTSLAREVQTLLGTDKHGVTRELDVARFPSLYTGDFGDCLGGESLFNITKFDAAYYADNLTVLFHLAGTTNIRHENLMLHIQVDAYGEKRFEMNFDPCAVNIYSLCPMNATVPITAWAVFPVAPSQVDSIPSIALDIPDFEGSARLQIFANSSQTQIGCFQAVMRNGNSFSHPQAISSTLGAFTLVAVLSSFATAIYGVNIVHMRIHYAHAFSVLIIFETFQAIFFSGALSVDWPSVLPAWWSNFAWSAGMIYSSRLVGAIDNFAGVSGNASQVGGAGSTVINTGGGLIQQIYGRSLDTLATGILKRAGAPYNASNPYDYRWAGNPVSPGMPVPGTWTGFGGELGPVNIPAADAFLIGLIWWMVGIAMVAFFTALFKFSLDLLIALKIINQDRFAYFRAHLPGYIGAGVLRTLLVAFFALTTLALFQFNIRGPVGPTAIAAVVFLVLVLGMGGVVAYACYARLKFGRYEVGRDVIIIEEGRLFKTVPFIAATRASTLGEKEATAKRYGSIPFLKVSFVDSDANRATVHKDEGYIKRFGWLSAHYRRTRWWFFACWFSYQLIRACFIGGGARNVMGQVYGLFIFEVIALVVFVKINPFEGSRNTAVAIWMLGISKVATAGLSIAFLPAFNIGRILSTVFGIIIIVIQGFLVVAVLILVILGAISSWMSLSRNRETFPERLDGVRIKYYEHVAEKATDLPPKKAKPSQSRSEVPPEPQRPYFSVTSVRRAPKIEDIAEEDTLADLDVPHNNSAVFLPVNRTSRTNSVSSRYSVGSLPRRARPHRTSWSSKEFAEWEAQFDRPDSTIGNRASSNHQRNSSLRQVQHLRSQPSLRQLQSATPPPERPKTSMDMTTNPETKDEATGNFLSVQTTPPAPAGERPGEMEVSPISEKDESRP